MDSFLFGFLDYYERRLYPPNHVHSYGGVQEKFKELLKMVLTIEIVTSINKNKNNTSR